MIGPEIRKALRLGAILYMVFGPLITLINVYESTSSPNFQIIESTLNFWLATIAGLVSTVIQGGILIALLSLDARLERRWADAS